jgi:hypothetical protein
LAQSTSRTLKPGSTLKLRSVLRETVSNTVICVSLPSFAAQASCVPLGLMVTRDTASTWPYASTGAGAAIATPSNTKYAQAASAAR